MKIKDRNLYLILSEDCGRGRPACEIARLAVSGGVDMLQMREKARPRGELVKMGRELQAICQKNNVKFIVNDDPAIAKETGADGVHLGQEDLKNHNAKQARRLLGPDKIIGVSTHSPGQFEEANAGDFDYIAFGPIFPTKTKDYFIGADDIEKIMRIARKPVVFIGGINLGNIDDILQKGGRNIALIRAILEADDIFKTTKRFKEKLERVK
ncbi:MAG: thiamine phosphate synthase [Candidatus Omnitrophota bacterium]